MTSDSLRREVVTALRQVATDHQCGAFNAIGEAFDRLAQQRRPIREVDPDLHAGIEFLDGWYDSSNHGWQFYEPLGEHDWPRLSRKLAASLEAGEPIDKGVRQRFTFAPRRGMLSEIRAALRRSEKGSERQR